MLELFGLWVTCRDAVRSWGHKEQDRTYSKLLFCVHGGRPTPSWSEYRRLGQFGRVTRLRASSHGEPMRGLVWCSYADGWMHHINVCPLYQ
jgi:hypothetical protein